VEYPWEGSDVLIRSLEGRRGRGRVSDWELWLGC